MPSRQAGKAAVIRQAAGHNGRRYMAAQQAGGRVLGGRQGRKAAGQRQGSAAGEAVRQAAARQA